MFAGRFFDPPVETTLLVSLLSALIALMLWLFDKGHSNLRALLLGSALATCGLLRYELITGHFPTDHISHFTNRGDIVVVRGTVARYPERRVEKLNLVFATHEIYVEEKISPTHGDILVSLVELDTTFNYGDELVVRGKLRKPRGRRNPGEFDYGDYLSAQGIYGTMSVNNPYQIRRISTTNGSRLLTAVIFPAKKYLETFIRDNLPPQEAALLSGLLIGERGEIPIELRDAFAKLGVIHILAVSGMHVGFIMLIFMGIIGFLRLPYWLRVALTILALIFYSYLTNLKPPVVRASIMGGLLLFGTLLERKTNVYNTLALAALFILILNPLEIFQSGFQLSFSAVLSIVYFYPKLKALKPVQNLLRRTKENAALRYPLDLALVSLAAFLGTLPFTLMYFNRLPNFALVANLFVIPFSFLGLANGLVAAIVNLFAPVLGKLFSASAWFFLHVLIEFVDWASALPFAQVEFYQLSIWNAVAYFVFLLLMFNFHRPVAKRWLLILGLCVANYFVWSQVRHEKNQLTVTFLDIGQGDAVLIRFPNGRHMLIDGGPRTMNSDAGEWVIEPYLKKAGIKVIDALVLSHADSDHLGGFPHLMRKFKIREVWDNGVMKETNLCREYLALIDSLQIPRRILQAGEIVSDFAPVQIFVIHPTTRFLQAHSDRLNDCSLSLKMSYGQTDFLFMGDVEHAGEAEIPRFGKLLESEVMKVSHHGSRTSSSNPILDFVRPGLAVVSVGEMNKFDHPHPEVLARLDSIEAQILRTDLDAAIILKSDGESIKRVSW